MIAQGNLIIKLRSGNTQTLNAVWEKYKTPLLKIALLLIEDPIAAQDVIHQAFVDFAAKTHSLRITDNIARYLAVDLIRQIRKKLDRKLYEVTELDHTHPRPSAMHDNELNPAQSQQYEFLESALKHLSLDHREIIALHLFAQMKFSEIALIQNSKAKNIEAIHKNAMDSICSILNSQPIQTVPWTKETVEDELHNAEYPYDPNTEKRILADAAAALAQTASPTNKTHIYILSVIAVIIIVAVIAATGILLNIKTTTPEVEPVDARKSISTEPQPVGIPDSPDITADKDTETSFPSGKLPIATEAAEPNTAVIHEQKLNTQMLALLEMYSAQDVNGLIKSLQTGPPPVQAVAARCLAQMGHPSALPVLEKLIHDQTPNAPNKLTQTIFLEAAQQIRKKINAEFISTDPNKISVTDANTAAADSNIPLPASSTTLTQTLAPCFVGYVTNETGLPILDAIISTDTGEFTYSDPNGQYILKLKPTDINTTTLIARAQDYAPDYRTNLKPGTVQNPSVANFSLQQGHWLEITALDNMSIPITDANVTVLFYDPNSDKAIFTITSQLTNQQGVAYFDSLPPDDVSLNIIHEDHLWITDYITQTDNQVNIVLEAPNFLNAIILDKQTDQPLTEFTAYLSAENFSKQYPIQTPDGRFSIMVQIPADVNLAIEAPGYPMTRFGYFTPQQDENALEFTLQMSTD